MTEKTEETYEIKRKGEKRVSARGTTSKTTSSKSKHMAEKTNKKTTTKKSTKTEDKENKRIADTITILEQEKEEEERIKKIEKEYDNENTLASTKMTKKMLEKQQLEELETVEKEIKEETTLKDNDEKSIIFNIFKCIVLAALILIFFIALTIIKMNANSAVNLITLKVSSMIFIILTIGIFEYSYKKESDKYAIIGIDILVLSISTLLARYIFLLYNKKYISAIISFALLFSVYYVGKAIFRYIKEKKEIRTRITEKLKKEMR